MPEATGALPKPRMRDLHVQFIKKGVVGMVIFTAAVTLGYKMLFVDPRRRKYERYYRTYNPEKALEEMNAAGLMQSCPQ